MGTSGHFSSVFVFCLISLTPFTGSVPVYRIPNSTPLQIETLESGISTGTNKTGVTDLNTTLPDDGSSDGQSSQFGDPYLGKLGEDDTLEEDSLETKDAGVSPTSSTEPIYGSSTTSVSTDSENPLVIPISNQQKGDSSQVDLSSLPNDPNLDLVAIFILSPINDPSSKFRQTSEEDKISLNNENQIDRAGKQESNQDRNRRDTDDVILLPDQDTPTIVIIEEDIQSTSTQESNDDETTTEEQTNESSTEISDIESEGSHSVVRRDTMGMTSGSSRNDDDNGEDAAGTSTPSPVTLHQGSAGEAARILFLEEILKDMAALDSQSRDTPSSAGGDEVPSPIRESHPDFTDDSPMTLQPSASKSTRRIPPTEFVGPSGEKAMAGESNEETPNYEDGMEFREMGDAQKPGSRVPIIVLLFMSPANVSRFNSTSNQIPLINHHGGPEEILSRKRRDASMDPSPVPSPPGPSSNPIDFVTPQPSDVTNVSPFIMLSQNALAPSDNVNNASSTNGTASPAGLTQTADNVGSSNATDGNSSSNLTPGGTSPNTATSGITATAAFNGTSINIGIISTNSSDYSSNSTSSSGNSTTNSPPADGNSTNAVNPNWTMGPNSETFTNVTSTNSTTNSENIVLPEPRSLEFTDKNDDCSEEDLVEDSNNTNGTIGSKLSNATISNTPVTSSSAGSSENTINVGALSSNGNASNSSLTSALNGNMTINSTNLNPASGNCNLTSSTNLTVSCTTSTTNNSDQTGTILPEGLSQNSTNNASTSSPSNVASPSPGVTTIATSPPTVIASGPNSATTNVISTTNSSASSLTMTASSGNVTTNSNWIAGNSTGSITSNGTSSTNSTFNATSITAMVNSTSSTNSDPPSPSSLNPTNGGSESPEGLTQNSGNNTATTGTNSGNSLPTTAINATITNSTAAGISPTLQGNGPTADISNSSNATSLTSSAGNVTTNASNAGNSPTPSNGATPTTTSPVAISVNSTTNLSGTPVPSSNTATMNSSSNFTISNSGEVPSSVLITGNSTGQTNVPSSVATNNEIQVLNSSTDASTTNNNSTMTGTNGSSTNGSLSQNVGSPIPNAGSNSSIPINLTSPANETTTTVGSNSTGTLATNSGPTTTSANNTGGNNTTSILTNITGSTNTSEDNGSNSNIPPAQNGTSMSPTPVSGQSNTNSTGSSSSGTGGSNSSTNFTNSVITGTENSTSANSTGILSGRSLDNSANQESPVGTSTNSNNSGSQDQSGVAPEGILAPPNSNSQTFAGADGKYEIDYTVSEAPKNLFYSVQETVGTNLSTGSYRVLLPDGRTEVVTYTADDSGYHPVIEYENSQPPTKSG